MCPSHEKPDEVETKSEVLKIVKNVKCYGGQEILVVLHYGG